jgi:hypothetical protein
MGVSAIESRLDEQVVPMSSVGIDEELVLYAVGSLVSALDRFHESFAPSRRGRARDARTGHGELARDEWIAKLEEARARSRWKACHRELAEFEQTPTRMHAWQNSPKKSAVFSRFAAPAL